MVGPVLEVWAKYKEAESLTSSDHSELVVSEVVVWFSRLVAAEVMGQCSIVIYGLSTSLSLREQKRR